MKKIIVFFIILVSISTCGISCYHTDNDSVGYGEFWQDGVGTYKSAVIPNEECAIAVAEAIFNNMNKSENMQDYTPQFTYFDKDNEIWVVSFGSESGLTTLGGDCSIAIQKADGKVLRIWFGE